MKLGVKREVEVDAKVLKLHLKVADMFTAELVGSNGEVLHDQSDGYVPKFMPGQHYGDYVILDIDVDTGMVLNWKPPTPEALRDWMDTGDE
jgi:hypothetical protein